MASRENFTRNLDYLPEMFELRKKGWSYLQLGKKFNKDHTIILAHCKKYGVCKNIATATVNENKYIFSKNCLYCKKEFITKIKQRRYCSLYCKVKRQREQVKKLKFAKINSVEWSIDERDEKINPGFNYWDYLLRANGGDVKKVKKILYNAKGRVTINLPRKTRAEIKKERDLATEKRLHGLKT